MTSASSMISSIKNNLNLRRKGSYFKNKNTTLKRNKRTGTPLEKFGVSTDAYTLTKERKALMFRKGVRSGIVFVLCAFLIAYLTLILMG